MPTLRGVTVSVISEHDGVTLQEWGTRQLRGAKTCSCYIESKTDVQFRIRITPTIPYVADDCPTAHGYNTRQRGRLKPGYEDVQMSDDKPQPPKHHPSNSEEHVKKEDEGQNTSLLHSVPDWNSSSRTPPPPFHFIASLYLDGRTKPERQVVVYLDPHNPDFNPPDGTVHFRSRWVRGADGVIRSHGWVFKDVGIETLFDKLQLSGAMASEGQILKKEEDDIIAAMNSTGLEDKEEKVAPGLIMVTLERVTLGEVWADRNFQPEHAEGEGDCEEEEGEESMEVTGTEGVSHTAGLIEGQPLPCTPIRVVTYQRFKKNGKRGGADEGLYATFKFFYRSADILRKFNFTGFPLPPEQPPPPKQSRTRRALAQKLAFLTPLSISNAPAKSTERQLEDSSRNDSALRSINGDEPAKAEGAASETRDRALTAEYKPYSSYRTHPGYSDEDEEGEMEMEVEETEGRVVKRSRVEDEQGNTEDVQDDSDL